MSVLLKALGDGNHNVRAGAAQALGGVAASDSEVRAALLKAVGDSDYDVRAGAAQALGGLAVSDSEVRAALLKALGDEYSSVRVEAAQALGELAASNSEVRAALLKALEDSKWQVRAKAVEALGGVAASDSEVQSALLKALGDWNEDVRAGAAQALGPFAASDSEVRAALLKALGDSEWYVRTRAAQALEKPFKLFNNQYQPLYQSLKKIVDEQQGTLASSMKLAELLDTITNKTASLNLLVSDELNEHGLMSMLKKAADTARQLQSIRIRGIQTQQKEALALIKQIVVNNSELTTLDLSQNHFGDVLMESLLTQTLPSCKKLSILMLHENDLTQASMKAVGLLLMHCPIEDLVLGGNKIGVKGIGMLMQALSNNTNCVLDTAPARGMTKTERGMTKEERGMTKEERGMIREERGMTKKECVTLEEEHGTTNEKHEKRATVGLKSLSLSGNPIGAKGLQYLASSQHLNLSDAALYLDNTQLDDNAWAALKQLLTNVRSISLKHNQLKDIKPLIELLPQCASLQQIYLEGNLFSKEDLKSLHNAVEKVYPNSRLSKSIKQAIDQLSSTNLLLLKPPSSFSNVNTHNANQQEKDVKEGKQEMENAFK